MKLLCAMLCVVLFNTHEEVVTVTSGLVVDFFHADHALDDSVRDALEEDSEELVIHKHPDFELFSNGMPGTRRHDFFLLLVLGGDHHRRTLKLYQKHFYKFTQVGPPYMSLTYMANATQCLLLPRQAEVEHDALDGGRPHARPAMALKAGEAKMTQGREKSL